MAGQDRWARGADGVRLAVYIAGDPGAEPVLLIPGWGAAASVFDPLVEHLQQRRQQCVRYDPRGLGASDPGDGTLTMAQMLDDAVSVLDGAGAATAVVVGASMGGVVAQHLAVRSGDRLRRLVLAATTPAAAGAIPADVAVSDALVGRGSRAPENAYRVACTVLYSRHFQRTHPEFIEDQIRQRREHPVRPRVFAAQLAAVNGAGDIGAQLGGLALPTLVMHGTADVVTPPANAETLSRLIPGARTRWFQDCGHLFFHERPEEAARVVSEFVRA